MTGTITTPTHDFTTVLNLSATPHDVLALFTSPGGVSRWWGPTQGEASIGAILITSFGEHGVNAMRVLETGPTRVVWEPITAEATIATAHTKEWLGTTIVFDIAPSGSRTQLRFRHTGLTPHLECWDACHSAWTYFMASIQAAAETGTGTPFQG